MGQPTFDPATSTITIPDTRVHKINGHVVTGDVHITKPTTVTVHASQGRVLPKDAQTKFTFEPTAVEPLVESEEPVVDADPPVTFLVDEDNDDSTEMTPAEVVERGRFGNR